MLSTALTTGIYGFGACVSSVSGAVVVPVKLADLGGAEIGYAIGDNTMVSPLR